MKKFIFALLLSSAPLMAADEFNLVYDCYTPNVADAGYHIRLVTGGIAGITQAVLGEEWFGGEKNLGTFYIEDTHVNSDKNEYVGQDFTLSVSQKASSNGPVGIPQASYDATFSAKVKGRTIQGPLACRSPQDPQ
jgi:hypothetical protein